MCGPLASLPSSLILRSRRLCRWWSPVSNRPERPVSTSRRSSSSFGVDPSSRPATAPEDVRRFERDAASHRADRRPRSDIGEMHALAGDTSLEFGRADRPSPFVERLRRPLGDHGFHAVDVAIENGESSDGLRPEDVGSDTDASECPAPRRVAPRITFVDRSSDDAEQECDRFGAAPRPASRAAASTGAIGDISAAVDDSEAAQFDGLGEIAEVRSVLLFEQFHRLLGGLDRAGDVTEGFERLSEDHAKRSDATLPSVRSPPLAWPGTQRLPPRPAGRPRGRRRPGPRDRARRWARCRAHRFVRSNAGHRRPDHPPHTPERGCGGRWTPGVAHRRPRRWTTR